MQISDTGLLLSVSFPSTAQWRSGRDCRIIQIGGNREKHLDNFSWGRFQTEENCFLKDPNVSRE